MSQFVIEAVVILLAAFPPPPKLEISVPEVQRLIQRAQKGDSKAVAQLYRTFAQRIYRYIAYRVSSSSDAEDLTAEVFVKMVEGLPVYRWTGAPFESWLYSIASARVIDFRRRTSRRPESELSETLDANEPLPEELLQDNQEIETLREAIQKLSDEQQTVLVLRFIERKSHQEVAEIIGKSVSAVKSIQHRALIELTAHLGLGEKVRHYLRGVSNE
ncbi:MAG: sigma-70 family RNA polymerase sigma factor [Anaerolineae bacterium]